MEDLLLPPKRVHVGHHALDGDLVVPPQARGLVVFAPGIGRTRRNPHHLQMAHALHECDLGTLLFDLAPSQAAPTGSEDTTLPGERLLEAIDWLDRRPALATLPLGLLGIDIGAAVALIAAAGRPQRVGAVVSCSGWLAPALETLSKVCAPTLLIAGGADTEVLAMNRKAHARLSGSGDLVVLPRIRHLFEQASARDRTCELACRWFTQRLPPRAKGARHG
jgi:putative phosphoribosyl transferase